LDQFGARTVSERPPISHVVHPCHGCAQLFDCKILEAVSVVQIISLYADDVVLFIQPHQEELRLVKETLRVFEVSSGLVTNISKSSIIPIGCGDQELERVQEVLPCNTSQFPCKYLGLPLSTKKLPKSELYPLIEKIAYQLPEWKAAFIHPAGRAALIKSVLTAIPIYHLIAGQCPKWVFRAIGKNQIGFVWRVQGCQRRSLFSWLAESVQTLGAHRVGNTQS
jgi:hypothetical protein